MKGYGTYLSNLRSNSNLSLGELARLIETSKSTLSRLENDEITQPFRGTMRKLVLSLAQMLCTSRRETERYLELAGIDRLLLMEVEEFQLGFPPSLTTSEAISPQEETASLQRWESIYQQIIDQLKDRDTKISDENALPQLKIKLQEYLLILQDIQRKLNRFDGQNAIKNVHTSLHSSNSDSEDEERVTVGTMYGKEINASHKVFDLYNLASQNAASLMQSANIDCFAVDDLITLTQSHAFAGWDRDDISITKLSIPLTVPQDIEALRKEKLPIIQRNFINSSHYRLTSYTPAFSDRRGLEITLAPIGFYDYYTLVPFLDDPLSINADGSTISIRKKYGHTALTYSTSGDHCQVPAPVSLQCVIVTKDHQIILMQRSNSVAFYPNHWSASFEETMDAPGVSPKGNIRAGDANFFDCAIRGLEEEFGISADAVKDIKMLSLNVEYLILAIGVVAIINLDLTVQEIKTHWLVKAPDKSEASKFATIPRDLPSVIEKLVSSDVLWHPTSRMRLIQYLFHTYGIDEVAKAIKAKLQP